MLVTDVHRPVSLVAAGDVARHLQAKDRLADAKATAKNEQLPCPQPTIQHVIQWVETGGHRLETSQIAPDHLLFYLLHHLREGHRTTAAKSPHIHHLCTQRWL